MTRRDFLAGTAALASMGLAGTALAARPSLMKPKALKPGARIALPAPASEGDYAADIARCRTFIEAQGWTPVEMKNAQNRFGYLAGTDEERAEDLNEAFRDDSIDGIICIRGGYGSMRILPFLDWKMIRRNPKVLMGFSDITALLVGISQRAGMATFHGPNALSTPNEYSDGWMRKAVAEAEPIGAWSQPSPLPSDAYQLATLHGGKGEGRLVGGNLTLLAHLMGTPWEPDLEDAILFIEDVGEAPYRLDRMLSQMRLAGSFQKCRGVAVGQFTNCDEKDPDSAWNVADVMRNRLADLGIPVVTGWAIGHVRPKLTLPLGCKAELDGDTLTFRVLEAAVQ